MKDTIIHTTETHLDLWDRIKVLLGKPVIVRSAIYCEAAPPDYIKVLRTEAKPMVPDLLSKKLNHGLGLKMTLYSPKK